MHTLESLVSTGIPVLVGMRQQTQFPVRLLDLALSTRRLDFLESQNLVKGGGSTSFYPYHCGLLFDCEGPACAAVVMLSVFRVTIRFCVCAGGLCGHGCFQRSPGRAGERGGETLSMSDGLDEGAQGDIGRGRVGSEWEFGGVGV